MRKLHWVVLFTMISLAASAQQPIQKTLYHEFGKPDLTQTSEQQINDIVQQLKGDNVRAILIKSHTDKIGTSEHNKQLSRQRSLAVLHLLQTLLPQKIAYNVSYFGEDSLLTKNDGEQDKNRRTEIIIQYNTSAQKEQITTLIPYIEDVPEQRYEIDLDDTVVITAKEGTSIKFAPGTFTNKGNKVATGKATFLIREYYRPADILLAGMQSTSDSGLLQTGGMLKLFIIQNNDTMKSETRLPVLLKMPGPDKQSAAMNLFTADHSDTALWKDTRGRFTQTLNYWDFPFGAKKMQDFIFFDWEQLDSLKIGKSLTEKTYLKAWNSNHTIYESDERRIAFKYRPELKYFTCTFIKIDSATVSVKLFEKFRPRGYRKNGISTFDTVFIAKRVRSVYQITTGGLAYINCDRFINAPQVTDFYVRTPGFEGAQLLVYFKDINAFMKAEYKNGRYQVRKVPAGEFVYLIAVGKKGNDFYYGKESFTISKKSTGSVAMQKVNYEEMKKMFDLLGYK